MHKLRVPVGELEIGMQVVELDRPWLETPFLLQGFTIETEADLIALRQYCRHVYVEVAKPYPRVARGTERPERKSPHHNGGDRSVPVKRGFFSLFRRDDKSLSVAKPVMAQLKSARPAHQQASKLLRTMMDDVRLGNTINTTAVRMQVRECVESILENPDAMMWLAQLKAKDERSSTHSLNVCILAVAFGRHLGLPVEELETLGLAALLHDIGKILLPTPLLHKQTELTGEDEAFLRRHTELSRQVLMNTRGLPGIIIDVAYGHHERMDGKGYPRGLPGHLIPPFVRMVSIVDAFEAMTSDHYYAEAIPPDEAIHRLREEAGAHFDAQLVKEFITLIGVFPVGSIVELSNGEAGVVITTCRRDPEHPKILVLRDAEKNPCRERVVNLADRQDGVSVLRLLKVGEYGIDVQAMLRQGLKLKVE